MAMTAILASCSKNMENTTPGTDNGQMVQITLTNEGNTRAFFDNTAAAETWENEITTLCAYVFDKNGNIVVKRTMTASEITAKSARFSLPNSAAGTQCSFYVVANADYGDVASSAALDSAIEAATLVEYNGTATETITARKRAAGFVMTGKTTQAIAAEGSATTVGVTLKRVVAKIAVQAQMSADFAANFNGGTVTITEAVISKANSVSYSFANAAGCHNNSGLYTHTQTTNASAGKMQNLFYIYENGEAASNADKVLLTLNGYFDADGNATTTNDRSDVSYKIYLDGAANGEIKRNGYYRVDATIKGLSGDGVIVNFTVENWQTPVTQTVDLGV